VTTTCGFNKAVFTVAQKLRSIWPSATVTRITRPPAAHSPLGGRARAGVRRKGATDDPGTHRFGAPR